MCAAPHKRDAVKHPPERYKRIRELLAGIPWSILLLFAFFLGLAPFKPQPHLLEKLTMLAGGNLSRPIDIFDLLFHASPLILIAAKLLFSQRADHDT